MARVTCPGYMSGRWCQCVDGTNDSLGRLAEKLKHPVSHSAKIITGVMVADFHVPSEVGLKDNVYILLKDMKSVSHVVTR